MRAGIIILFLMGFVFSLQAQVVYGNYEFLDTHYPLDDDSSYIRHEILSIHDDGTFQLDLLEPEHLSKQGSFKGKWSITNDHLTLVDKKSAQKTMLLTLKPYRLEFINEDDYQKIYNLLDD